MSADHQIERIKCGRLVHTGPNDPQGLRDGVVLGQWYCDAKQYFWGFSQCSHCEAVEKGQWGFLRFFHSGKVLDCKDASKDDGAALQQWDQQLKPTDNQLFRFEPQADGWALLRIRHSGKVIDIQEQSTENGAALHQRSAHGGDSQLFKLEDAGESADVQGWQRLRNKGSGKVAEVAEFSRSKGAPLHQWSDCGTCVLYKR